MVNHPPGSTMRLLAPWPSLGWLSKAHLAVPRTSSGASTADGRLFLLQSRPITASAASAPQPSKEGQTLVVWSNANVNENFPDPISPLLYSIASLGYYHYFRNLGIALGISRPRIEAMEQPLRHLVGVHGARLYYNLTNIHAVLRMAPFGELLADSFNQFVGAENTIPAGGRLTWNGFRGAASSSRWKLSKSSPAACGNCCGSARAVSRFERTIDRVRRRNRAGGARSRVAAESARPLAPLSCTSAATIGWMRRWPMHPPCSAMDCSSGCSRQSFPAKETPRSTILCSRVCGTS